MGHLWKSFVDAVTKDELFIRVTLALFGLGATALGLLALSEIVSSNEFWGWLLILWVAATINGVGLDIPTTSYFWTFLIFFSLQSHASETWQKILCDLY